MCTFDLQWCAHLIYNFWLAIMYLDNSRFILQLLNHDWTSHFKLHCFEIILWIQETFNLNGKFFLLWWDLNSGPPALQLSSNLIFRSLSLLLFWPFGEIGWLNLVQLSPTSWRSLVRVPIHLQTSVWGGLTASSLPISTVPSHGITALATTPGSNESRLVTG